MSVSRRYAVEVELPAEACRHQPWSAADVSSDLRLLWLVDQVRQRRLGYAKAAELAHMPQGVFDEVVVVGAGLPGAAEVGAPAVGPDAWLQVADGAGAPTEGAAGFRAVAVGRPCRPGPHLRRRACGWLTSPGFGISHTRRLRNHPSNRPSPPEVVHSTLPRPRMSVARLARLAPAAFVALSLAACSQDFKLAAQVSTLSVTPLTSDAGVVPVGTTTDLPLTLYAKNGDVTVISIDVLNESGSYFAVTDTTMPIVATGATATINLQYAPTDAGLHWAQVTVNTDEGDGIAHVVDLRGEAATPSARIYPSILDFGPVQSGTTASLRATLENEGAVPLSLASVAVDNSRFSVTNSLPVDLAAGASVALTVTYSGADESEQTGTATLDLGATVPPLTLRANACSTASGSLYDVDGDGFSFCGGDCNDWDAAINPAASETCDGVDQDCDGTIDEGTSCYDDDGDGVTEDSGDCNDGDPNVNPNATEVPDNGIDDDCDGQTDSNAVDGDNDGYSTSGGDCNDGDASVYPGAPEAADGVDDDCDGTVDEGTVNYDDDGDGYIEAAGDCDDTDAGVAPGKREIADWADNDCDGIVDEGTDYYDDDGDGWTETGGDCDDTDAAVNPGATEIVGNHIDDNCDGVRL